MCSFVYFPAENLDLPGDLFCSQCYPRLGALMCPLGLKRGIPSYKTESALKGTAKVTFADA